ncbi:MAG: FAD-dependent oxidoreductase [Chthoniobacteraceae bacterium]
MNRIFSLFLALAGISAAAERRADVLVYGSTPAGVCAAVGAAREGASVLLVEPTGHVGGVNAGGLCFSDSNQMVREALRGLFEEFHLRIEADYTKRGVTLPYRVAEKDTKPWTYEPHVAARVFDAMLREAGVQVLTARVLDRVEKDGARIARIATKDGDVFAAKTFIDATYEGDLMAAAGVKWTIGREGRGEFGESLAGKQWPKQPMKMSGLDANGALLPLITTKDAGADEDGDRHVMTYSFRLCLTTDPANRVPFPEPANYDAARFEAVRRYFAQEKKPIVLWDLYPLPGGKTDANNGIGKQFSMGIIGGGDAWCEADAAGRARIWEAHKQYTLEMYRFLTTDEAVPLALREALAKYGLCRDEFAAHGHWSPQLYVREGRRMRGAHVLTQADILTHGAKPDSIAVASFPIDSHDCQRVARGAGEVINEGTIFPARDTVTRRGPAYQVPYRAITPKADECTNLLVPVALSATHVAYSSVRVEPAWMTIGHSAGIAAALAAKGGSDVQRIDYGALKQRLLAQGQVIDLRDAGAAAGWAHTELWRRFVDERGVVLDYTALDGSYPRPTPEDCREMKPSALSWGVPSEDGPMFNGLYLDAMCNRWKLTRADADRAKARRLVEGLMFLASVGRTPGFIARGVATDGKTTYPMGSNDQTMPWLYGIWRYVNDGVATPAERERLVAKFVGIVEVIARSEWRMPCDGPPSPYRGDFSKPTWEGAPRLLFAMKAMHQFTGDARWQQRYFDAANERVGNGQRTRIEICRTGMEFDPGQGPRNSWTGSVSVVALRALWEMETDEKLRAAYAEGLRASAALSATSLALWEKFDVNGSEVFNPDWRVMDGAWKPQHSEADAVAVANAGLRLQHKASPRLGIEKNLMREPSFAAWVVTLCPDAAFVNQHRASIERTLTHYQFDKLHLSQFFPLESAWLRLRMLDQR